MYVCIVQYIHVFKQSAKVGGLMEKLECHTLGLNLREICAASEIPNRCRLAYGAAGGACRGAPGGGGGGERVRDFRMAANSSKTRDEKVSDLHTAYSE